MGRPPAIVIVARHGARLDAADTQWHLTSPTPYDPPLTYGGWRQSQALGARIAGIIHSKEAAASSRALNGYRSDSEANSEGENESRHRHQPQRGRRRKHRVVIHSSPFLRCIQTSIAISAGIAQDERSSEDHNHAVHPKRHPMHSGSPHVQNFEQSTISHLTAIPEPENSATLSRNDSPVYRDIRSILRIDAFLGEWQSPEYFDKITPPPESKLMLASAKANLLRQEDPIDGGDLSDSASSAKGHFPGGWGSSTLTNPKSQDYDDTPLADLSTLGKILPKLGRANSHDLGNLEKPSSGNLFDNKGSDPTERKIPYVPPVPAYAVSPSQPIPAGYVAHAREACIKVDYQWDSSRSPHDWGDGGAYGEEWSSMHKRFRRGLQEMLSWYRNHSPLELLEDSDNEPTNIPEDDERDTVLVLVTHGAGSNALIGALTNQPVLLDVGMASLTMAVRKTIDYKRVASPTDPNGPTSPSHRRRSVIDLGIADDYDVKLIASTDHLRAGSRYLAGTQIQRTATMPIRNKSPYRYEKPHFPTKHRPNSSAIDDDETTYLESPGVTPTKANAFGPMQQSPTTAAKPLNGGGLWTKSDVGQSDGHLNSESRTPISQASGNAPEQVLRVDGDFNTSAASLQNRVQSPVAIEKHPDAADTRVSSRNGFQGRSIAPAGLWGAPPQAIGTERDMGAKRRWTLSQTS